jgi:TatA/E family protein of Tat protein translocase
MFGSIGGPELILIFVVALLIFGPRKLPELGKVIGKGLAEFRKASTDLRQTLETEIARSEPTISHAPASTEPAASAPAMAGGTDAGTGRETQH